MHAPIARVKAHRVAVIEAFGVAYQPAGAGEALGTIAIGVVLFMLRRRGMRVGVLATTYFTAYAAFQFLLFCVRESERVVGPARRCSSGDARRRLNAAPTRLAPVPMAWAR